MVPWICYFFHSNRKVQSAHMALSHLWFAFVSCLKQGLCSSLAFFQLWCGSFVGNHCLQKPMLNTKTHVESQTEQSIIIIIKKSVMRTRKCYSQHSEES